MGPDLQRCGLDLNLAFVFVKIFFLSESLAVTPALELVKEEHLESEV